MALNTRNVENIFFTVYVFVYLLDLFIYRQELILISNIFSVGT